MSVDGLNSTVVAWGVAADAQLQAQKAQAGEQAAKNRLAEMEIENLGSSSKGSAASAQLIEEKKKTGRLLRKNTELGTALEARESEVSMLKEALADRDRAILEWMHNEASYKRLAINFGKKLGLSGKEMEKESDLVIVDVANENSKFSNTGVLAEATAALGERRPE